MQASPPIYRNEIDADSRTLGLLITLWRTNEDGQDVFWRLTQDSVESIDCIQELKDAGIPCSYIGSNIFTAKIYNENGILFSEEYNLHKFLKRGTRVEVEIRTVPNRQDVWSQYLFMGYADSWEMSDDGNFCTLTAYDKLHFLGKQPTPWFRPTGFFSSQGMTLAEFIKYWFDLIGLKEDEYEIDTGLVYQPRFVYTSNTTNEEVFKMIAQTGLCAIYCDAVGKIKIEMVPKTRKVVRNFDDMTQVFSSYYSQLGYSDYTHVDVISHTIPSFDNLDFSITSQSYTSLSTTSFVSGEHTFNDISMTEGRMPTAIRTVSSERISQAEHNKIGPYITVKDYDYTNSITSITLNTDIPISSEVAVYFVNLDVSKATSHEVASPDYEENFFNIKKVLTIDSDLINSDDYAQQVADTYSKILVDAKSAVSASLRGDPAIELLDLISITNPRAGMVEEAVLPTRLRYTYDGGLTCDMEAIMYSAVSMMLYAYIAPGQYVPFDSMAVYISATTDPVGMGVISGTGPYAIGDACTLSCIPMEGYEFSHWADMYGNVISRSSEYTFEVGTQRDFVCHLIIAASYTSFTLDVVTDLSIKLPVMSLTPAVGTIDWGDGTIEEYNAEEPAKHNYSMPATYTVTLRAPITNMPAEIFMNSTTINRFTSGSDMLYLPGGMFYNSTVANVDFKATPNLAAYNNTVYVTSTVNTYITGTNGNLAITSSLANITIPKYHNTIFTTNAVIQNAASSAVVSFNDASMLSNVVINSSNVGTIYLPEMLERLNVYNIGVNTISIPNSTRYASISAPSVEEVIVPNSPILLFTLNTVNTVYVNDSSYRTYISIGETNANISIPSSLANITIVGNNYTLIRR